MFPSLFNPWLASAWCIFPPSVITDRALGLSDSGRGKQEGSADRNWPCLRERKTINKKAFSEGTKGRSTRGEDGIWPERIKEEYLL